MTRAARLALALLVLAAVVWLAAYVVYGRAKVDALDATAPAGRTAEAGTGSRGVLLIGDSRVAQWPLEPISGWSTTSWGFSGATARSIERAVRRRTIDADVVLVQAGINDVTAAAFQRGAERGRTLQHARDAVLAIAERARAAGAGEVVVMTPPPPIDTEWWKRLLVGDQQTTLAERLHRDLSAAARRAGFEVLDGDAVFRDAQGDLDPRFRRDGLHWSPAAYAKLDERLRDSLDRRAPEDD